MAQEKTGLRHPKTPANDHFLDAGDAGDAKFSILDKINKVSNREIQSSKVLERVGKSASPASLRHPAAKTPANSNILGVTQRVTQNENGPNFCVTHEPVPPDVEQQDPDSIFWKEGA